MQIFGGRYGPISLIPLTISFLTPFVTDLDDRICISSLPFPSDVAELVSKHRVGAVVNMCGEYSGPVKEYKKAGIAQVRLPTGKRSGYLRNNNCLVDTEAPALEDIRKGIKFMTEFLEKEKDKRVLVHCKGGRGRAATMVLCYYVSLGRDARETLQGMQQKRSVIVPTILHYSVVNIIADIYKNEK